ncbi:metalloproteinase inhibitor 2a isoform X1 [Phycodurus eques]|uniref:metalloproteinase inhibitor 2a isoform X1 n=2 Tax=Phycodurus eques TaxID=693459 RepID=UPI002ACEC2E2|nr:metalloproteinase inhibitor 2a isoform X1 [Phycodurus eques]
MRDETRLHFCDKKNEIRFTLKIAPPTLEKKIYSKFKTPSGSASTMPLSVNGVVCTLALLLVWRAEELAEACSCAPVHPQQAFCNADVVIRAKVVGEREVDSGNDIYGNPIKRIQYDVKQIKMFKGPSQDIDTIFTAPVSAVCGVTLDTSGKKEYLISGKSDAGGQMHVTLCDYIMPWDLLSNTQKKSLTQRYQMGCECKIVRCPSLPCEISAPEECLWTDLMIEKQVYGRQANHYACVKRADGSCSWYRGVAPPKKEFLDAEDP